MLISEARLHGYSCAVFCRECSVGRELDLLPFELRPELTFEELFQRLKCPTHKTRPVLLAVSTMKVGKLVDVLRLER